MYILKTISKDAVPAALERAKQYRLLGDPLEAESICRDILEVEPDNQDALITLLMQTVRDDYGLGKLQHWQVQRARIEVQPPQSVQVDGDSLGNSPLEASCLPDALRVIVPPE